MSIEYIDSDYDRDPRLVDECYHCGEEVYEGDEVYMIDDHCWCEKCIYEARTYAEYERPDEEFER